MKKILISLGVAGVFLLLCAKTSVTQEDFKTLNSITVEGNNVIIGLSGETKYNVFRITNPPKLVVEFANTEYNSKQKVLQVNKSLIKRIRSGQFKNDPVKVARVVIDLTKMPKYELKTEGNNVVIYFTPVDKTSAKQVTQKPSSVTPAAVSGVKTVPASIPPVEVQAQPLDNKVQTPAAAEQKKGTQPVTVAQNTTPAEPSAAISPAPVVVKAMPKKQKRKKPQYNNMQTKVDTDPLNNPEAKLVTLPKTPVTLDFEDADIRDVLRVLSVKSGINIIFSDDVKGNVTLHLENVPFDKALATILSLNALVSQEQGPNILRVATPQKISEERSMAVTFTKVYPLNYAKAEEVRTNLDSVRTAEGRKGNTSVDARTNSLVVTDTPEGLISVERLIAQLDKKPQQVLIEAKIVEITLSNSDDMGIQWQFAGTPVNTDNTRVDIGQSAAVTGDPVLGAGTAGLAQRNVSNITVGGTGVNFPAAPAGGQAGSIAFGIVANNNFLTGALTALSQKGLSKTLSTPRVTTINNQEAKILVGQKIPFSSSLTQSSIGQTTNTQFLDVGIKLTVVPTINVNNKITLFVHPEVSLFVRADPAGPVLGTREAQTTVMVENGETVVIGGLITEEDQKLGTQVPILGDLPVIGHLFRRDYNTKDRTELLVFITPKIID